MAKITEPIFTGERLIPSRNKGAAFYYEHLSRYLFASQITKNKVILDLGCGTGYGSYILAKYGSAKRVVAVDIDHDSILYAQKKYFHPKIKFNLDDITKLQTVKDHTIDLITCYEVIEHIKDHKNLLIQIKRVLKPSGILVISSPNKLTYPPGNPFHVHELTPQGFANLLEKNFKHVQNYYQNFVLTNNIRADATTNVHLEQSFAQLDTCSYYPPLSIKNTEYLVSICSMSAIPSHHPVSISSNNVDGLDLSTGILSLSNQFFNTQIEVNALKTQLNLVLDELNVIKGSKLYKLWPWYNRLKRIFGH